MLYTAIRLVLLEYMVVLCTYMIVIFRLVMVTFISAHTQPVKCQTYSGTTDHCWRSSILCCYLVMQWRRPAPPWTQNRQARLYSFSNIYLLCPTHHKRQAICLYSTYTPNVMESKQIGWIDFGDYYAFFKHGNPIPGRDDLYIEIVPWSLVFQNRTSHLATYIPSWNK